MSRPARTGDWTFRHKVLLVDLPVVLAKRVEKHINNLQKQTFVNCPL